MEKHLYKKIYETQLKRESVVFEPGPLLSTPFPAAQEKDTTPDWWSQGHKTSSLPAPSGRAFFVGVA